MNRDDVIRMAREADPFGDDGRLVSLAMLTPGTLERFAALVAAREREACAQVCRHAMQCAINKTDSQRILELTAQLTEAQRRIKELETPTMFWDFNNPEHGAFDSPYYAICDGDFDEGAEVSLITARSLPTKTVRVTRDSEGNYDYEYIDSVKGTNNGAR